MSFASAGAALAALVVLALITTIELIVIAPHIGVIALIATAAWFAAPGVALIARVVSTQDRASAARWLAGPGLGIGLSVFGLLPWWAMGLQNWIALLLAPLFTWALVWLAGRWGVSRLTLPPLTQRDVSAAAIALLVVPIVTFVPYDHVAERVENGQAYRAYFTADFVWAMTVTAELAKGDVPPVNPFLRGEPVRYYWMSHLLSGAFYRNVRAWAMTAEQVVLVDGVVFGLAFVAFFYYLARAFGASPPFAAAGVMIGFLANSYEALDRLWILWQAGESFEFVKTINIDAVTRWFYQGMPVDGLQRLLLYQPHHLTGYVFALSALALVGFADDVVETSVSLWAGILLGLSFLFSTFTAIIVGVAVGLLYAARLIARREFGAIWQCAILGGGPVIAAIGVSTLLGYTDPGHGFLMQFGLNPVALRSWPWMLLLSFGPLLFLGLAGLLRPSWIRARGAALLALVISALLFYFVADVPDMGGVWVGWRAGHLLLISFSIAAASVLTTGWQRRALRWPLAAAVAAGVALAIPTVAIDVYNAQDITNRGPGPSFPWTLVITDREREALDWIKRATPTDAVVQVEPTLRDSGTWAYVPAFSERRMAAGLPISMIPLAPYQAATDSVRLGIFNASSARGAHAMAQRLGIDYVVVGDVEREQYARAVDLIAASPEFFAPVFRNEAVTVFGVNKR